MNDLRVHVRHAHPAAATAAPAIVFRMRVENHGPERIHAIVLRCHIRIEARARRYADDEKERLYELFGHPHQWRRTLRDLTWVQSSLVVPSFVQDTDVELTVPITYDLEVASAKYLHALRIGEIPLLFLFSGTVFRAGLAGLQIEPVSWDVDASYRMPAETWTAAMNQFFPGGGWLRVSRDTIDRLQSFRGQQAVISWDDTIDRLLSASAPEQAV